MRTSYWGPTLNDDVLGGPLLVEGGERGQLADADHVLPEVKDLGVELQQTQPQLPHRLHVLPVLRPATGLQKGAKTYV